MLSFVVHSDNAGQQQQGAAPPQTTNATNAATKPDPPDVLPKAKCLEALAALRHAKWFQVWIIWKRSSQFANANERLIFMNIWWNFGGYSLVIFLKSDDRK